jgi:hypothetical protein
MKQQEPEKIQKTSYCSTPGVCGACVNVCDNVCANVWVNVCDNMCVNVCVRVWWVFRAVLFTTHVYSRRCSCSDTAGTSMESRTESRACKVSRTRTVSTGPTMGPRASATTGCRRNIWPTKFWQRACSEYMHLFFATQTLAQRAFPGGKYRGKSTGCHTERHYALPSA